MKSRLAAVALLAMLGVVAPITARATNGAICTDGVTPVSFGPGAPNTLEIANRLCEPAGGADTVQVLVSGSALTLEYWDPRFQPERYSMVRALNVAGFATFTYDRVGTARSSKPPSPLMNMDVDAWNLHQIVEQLRTRYDHVLTLGVSSGAAVAALESARFHDIDGIVLIGLVHDMNDVQLMLAAPHMKPAILDPKWAASGLDPGYVTFDDVSFALAPGDTDPTMQRYLMEHLRDVITLTQQAGVLSYVYVTAANETSAVDVPVLVAVGEHDLVNCDFPGTDCSDATTVKAAEAPYFPAAARLDAFVLPGAGHSLNSELNAPDWFAAEIGWANSVAPG